MASSQFNDIHDLDHEELCRCLFDESNDAFLILDPDLNTILDVNATTQRLTGFRRKQLQGTDIRNVLSAAGKAKSLDNVMDAFRRTGVFHSKEGYTLERAGKQPLSVNVSVSRIHTNGRALGLVVARDITDRKEAERQMQEIVAGTAAVTGDEFFPLLAAHLGRALGLCAAIIGEFRGEDRDALHSLGVWCDGAKVGPLRMRVEGSPLGEIIFGGAHFCERGLQERFPDCEFVLELGADSCYGVAIRDSSGDLLGSLCVFDSKPLPKKDDRLISLLTVFAARAGAEIERRRVEQYLRESRAQLAGVLENAMDVILSLDLVGKILYINRPLRDQLVENVIGSSALELLPPDWHDRLRDAMGSVRETGVANQFEVQSVSADGQPIWYSCRIGPVMIDGQLVRFTVCAHDVTERRRQEHRLRLAEHAVQTAQDAVFWIRPDGTFVYVNEKAAESLQHSADELCTMRVADIDPNFTQQVWTEKWSMTRASQPWLFESIHRRKDGTQFAVEISASRVVFEGQELGVSFARDITERQRVSEELRDSKEVLRQVLDNLPQMVLWKDTEGRFLGCNQTAATFTGNGDPESIIGLSDFDRPISPLDAEKYQESDRRVIESDTAEYNIEEPIHFSGGDTLWLDTTKVPLHSEDGDVIGVLAIVEDITERKQASDTLEENRLFIEAVATATHYFLYVIDVDSLEVTYLNRSLSAELGYGNHELFPKTLEDILNFMPPEERQHLTTVVEEWHALDSHEVREDEYYFATADGTVRSFLSREVVFTTSKSTSARQILGTAFDITERKAAEDSLRESEARWRSLTEHSLDHVLTLDTDLVIQFCNFASPGLTVDDLIGTQLHTYMNEAQQSKVERTLRNVLATQNPAEYETEYDDPNGGKIYYESRVSPRIDDGDVFGLTVHSRNVTRRRRAEDSLRFVVEGTAQATGDTFNRSLVECLAKAIGLRFVLLAEFVGEDQSHAQTLSVWAGDHHAENFGYALAGTPCENVKQGFCTYPTGVQQAFPVDDLLREMGVDSYIGTPLIGADSEPIGLLVALDTQPILEHPEMKALFQVFAKRAATELERNRVEVALHHSKKELQQMHERLALAIQGTSDGVWDWDVLNGSVWCSPRGMELLGEEEQELIWDATTWEDRIHPDDLEDVKQAMSQHFERGALYDIELRMRLADGNYRWFRSRGRATRDEKGVPIRVSGSFLDIRHQKQAEAEREKRIRHLYALDRIHHVIGAASTVDEMLENVMPEVLDIMDCDRAWLGYPCDPSAETTRLLVSCSREELPGIVDSSDSLPVDDKSRRAMQLMLDRDEPVCFQGASVGDAISPDLASEYHIRSLMFLALRPRTGQAWSLSLHQCSHERVWSDDDKRLLRDMGRRIEDAITSLLSIRELRESEQQYRTLLENHVDGVAVLVDGRIQYVNDPMSVLCGYDSRELIGWTLRDFVCAKDQLRADRIAELARAGEENSGEYEIVQKCGSFVSVEICSRPIRYQGGPALLSVIRDISKRKRMEEESRKHQRLLAHANRVATMGEMATGFAHELNQPLAAMTMYADVCIANMNSSPSKVKDVSVILPKLSEQAVRAGEIVDRIRKFIGKEDFLRTKCRVRDLFDDVLSLLQSEMAEREIGVDVRVPDTLADVFVDRVQIEQVLVNLIHNSVDAVSACSTSRRRLELSADDRGDGFVGIEVRDHGAGVTDEVATRVFDAFYSTKSHGMGVGLAICRTIVESHGGIIEMVPHSSEGVTMTFTLPIFRS